MSLPLLTLLKAGAKLSDLKNYRSTTNQAVMKELSSILELPKKLLKQVFDMREEGMTPAQISQLLSISLDTLKLFLPFHEEQEDNGWRVKASYKPKSFFNIISDQLYYKTDLESRTETSVTLNRKLLRAYFRYCEVPCGRLFLTGGYTTQFECIDSLRDMSYTLWPDTLVAAGGCAPVYHQNSLYLISSPFNQKFDFRYNRWELFAETPRKVTLASSVVLGATQSLYVVGGYCEKILLHQIQCCNLVTLTWTVMEINLPNLQWQPECFKVDENKFYFIMIKYLYVFSPVSTTIEKVKELPKPVSPAFCSSLYYEGWLFIANNLGRTRRLEVGSLE
mmetsp:Transcript_26790/g.48284  ORF Transcript_26790/g.48284 Transcript_26790/m.48284 type:complete len:335 (+) Transcript_26790:302-1306(+)